MNQRFVISLIFLGLHASPICAGPQPPADAIGVFLRLDMPDLLATPFAFFELRRCFVGRRGCTDGSWQMVQSVSGDFQIEDQVIEPSFSPRAWTSGATVEWSIVSNPEWQLRFHVDNRSIDGVRWLVVCTMDKDSAGLFNCEAVPIEGTETQDVIGYLNLFWGGDPVTFRASVFNWTSFVDGLHFGGIENTATWRFPTGTGSIGPVDR